MVPLALEDLLGDPSDLDPIQRILLQNGGDFPLPRIFPLLLFCNTPPPPNGVILLLVYPCVPEMDKQTKFGQSREHCFILNLSNTANKKSGKLFVLFPLPVLFLFPLSTKLVFLHFAETATATRFNINHQIRLNFFLKKKKNK